ncbi:hypothetical protein SSYM_1086 [Serratia symbiotica str. Tucson]|uniref:Uncharacterized protein n=1 Tax=Serratia symbiotica str. Tucson TaxID=914128 RepID=E9CLG9_9GAMM|nr:hypothetical protein SSYM_1086 [Serratia symbiotica str. Tucson]
MVDHTHRHKKKILQAAVITYRRPLAVIETMPSTLAFLGIDHATSPMLIYLIGDNNAKKE